MGRGGRRHGAVQSADVIRRPRDARRFNGILVVEWLNVSALIEGAADYMQMEEEIVREGYAWVGIGAQNAGVNAPRSGLKAWDPRGTHRSRIPAISIRTTSSRKPCCR